ncbi:MAG: hypothetical protein ABEL76_10505 [Bradymonadaceae bacterium]
MPEHLALAPPKPMPSDPDIERTVEQLRSDGPARFLLTGLEDPIYRWVVRLFVLGSAAHLWLRNAWSLEWLFADLVYTAGLGLLAWRGALLGWLLSAWGLLEPLLFHRDFLTQSVILLAIAGAGAAATALRAWGRVRQSEAHEADPGPWVDAFLRAVQWICILTYACAALHKLNVDFLARPNSCALYGVDELLTYWRAGADVPGWLVPWLPWVIVGTEGGIAALHLLRLRRLAWTAAAAFHIPLTLTMAPAFAFVMACAHASFLVARDLARIRKTLGRYGSKIAAAGAAATAASLAAHADWPGAAMALKEAILWSALLGLAVAFPPWTDAAWDRARSPLEGADPRAVLLPAAVAGLFALNCLTPYLGLQYQHTAAMVSNLRIDRGCWNSAVVPESVRLRDPYIRVDEVYFKEPGAIPEYEEIVRTKLWSPPEIRQMRRNWCRPEVRPFYIRGTHLGETFEIEDLCAGKPLPFDEWRPFGVPVFGDFLRFQKNLQRDCDQPCIH